MAAKKALNREKSILIQTANTADFSGPKQTVLAQAISGADGNYGHVR
jgi:hypothetical protein